MQPCEKHHGAHRQALYHESPLVCTKTAGSGCLWGDYTTFTHKALGGFDASSGEWSKVVQKLLKTKQPRTEGRSAAVKLLHEHLVKHQQPQWISINCLFLTTAVRKAVVTGQVSSGFSELRLIRRSWTFTATLLLCILKTSVLGRRHIVRHCPPSSKTWQLLTDDWLLYSVVQTSLSPETEP